MSSTLEAIWIKRAKRGPMDPVESVRAFANRGLETNADQRGKRQVTVIEREAFDAVSREMGRTVDPRVRRANLLVSGIRLAGTRGKILRIGDLRIEIFGETRPCERMDEAVPGLRKALDPDWRGGVYGVVLNDCVLRVGDAADWE